MCVAIAVPERVSINRETLKKAWAGNPDGGGFAYVKDGKVVVSKGHMKFSEFMEAYSAARSETIDSPYIIHFRIRTHGATDAARTHPFVVGTELNAALIHNGMLSCVEDDSVKSDTQIFCETYPALFDRPDVLRNVREKLGDFIGSSKFVTLFPNKDVVIVNERYGSWVDGVWYSNRHWNSYGGYPYYED